MRILLALIFSLLTIYGNGQVIQGTVVNEADSTPIEGANVYFYGTLKGTTTDQRGKFNLDGEAHPGHAIVISMMGYYSATITEYSAEETLLIVLRGQTISIDAVEVVYDRTEALRVRKKNLRYFEKEFLGSEYNARKCHILNEEVIQFSNNKGDSLFDAFAYEPIVIHNEALGYTLIYHLDSFAKNREQVHYQGVYYFIEDEFKTNRSNRRALKRRTAAFEGSRMHFVRSLYDDELNEAGFLICDTTGKALERNDIIIDQNQNTAFISGNRALEYYYYPDKNNILSFSANFLKMQTDQVLISKEGYFDPIQCAWGGRTTKERVGMLLPFGYKPDH